MQVIKQLISIQDLKILKSEIVLTSTREECLRFLLYQKLLHSLVFRVVDKSSYILINQNKMIKKYVLK
jgi:hypothetical protein